MDNKDFFERNFSLFSDMQTAGKEGAAKITAQMTALRDDLDRALKNGEENNSDLMEMRESIDLMLEGFSMPGIAEQMLESMAEPVAPNPAIFDAIDDENLDQLRQELAFSDINAQYGKYKSSALYHALSSMHGVSLEIVNLLLDAGADPKVGLGDGNVLGGLGFGHFRDVSPEDLAVVVKRCVDLGADIEQRSDRLLWTPLILAASEWNPVAVEALLLAGADVHAHSGNVEGVCFSGSQPIDYASGHPETEAVLRRFMTAQ